MFELVLVSNLLRYFEPSLLVVPSTAKRGYCGETIHLGLKWLQASPKRCYNAIFVATRFLSSAVTRAALIDIDSLGFVHQKDETSQDDLASLIIQIDEV